MLQFFALRDFPEKSVAHGKQGHSVPIAIHELYLDVVAWMDLHDHTSITLSESKLREVNVQSN